MPSERRAKLLLFAASSTVGILMVEGMCAVLFSEIPDDAQRLTRRHHPVTKDVEARIDDYVREHDPSLGWVLHRDVDASGSRIVPSFPEPGGACASIYGDSFAFADDVENVDAWGNVMARKIGCRVANYGVPGYGTDQALLRFQGNLEDEAPVVILTIFPINLLRNLTRNSAHMGATFSRYGGQKPRFILDGDRLEPIPLPRITKERCVGLVEDVLSGDAEHDWFWPGSDRRRLFIVEPPYTLTLLGIAMGESVQLSVRRSLTGKPKNFDYYQPGHESRSLELVGAIVRRFRALAAARGKAAHVVVIPDPEIVAYFEGKGVWADAALVEATEGLHLGPKLLDALDGAPYASIVSATNHFNAQGYRLFGEIVATELKFVPDP